MSALPNKEDIANAIEEASHERPVDRVLDGRWRLFLERRQPYLCGSLEPLSVGKVGLGHQGTVEELWWRQILSRPRLRPFYLRTAATREKLERLATHRGPAIDSLLENTG